MSLLDELAEARIVAAQERGEFEDLPNAGEPIAIDDDRLIAPQWRMAFRVLRNAGYLPPELCARKEQAELEALLSELTDVGERQRARQRLELLRAFVTLDRHERSAWLEDAEYRARIVDKLALSKR